MIQNTLEWHGHRRAFLQAAAGVLASSGVLNATASAATAAVDVGAAELVVFDRLGDAYRATNLVHVMPSRADARTLLTETLSGASAEQRLGASHALKTTLAVTDKVDSPARLVEELMDQLNGMMARGFTIEDQALLTAMSLAGPPLESDPVGRFIGAALELAGEESRR